MLPMFQQILLGLFEHFRIIFEMTDSTITGAAKKLTHLAGGMITINAKVATIAGSSTANSTTIPLSDNHHGEIVSSHAEFLLKQTGALNFLAAIGVPFGSANRFFQKTFVSLFVLVLTSAQFLLGSRFLIVSLFVGSHTEFTNSRKPIRTIAVLPKLKLVLGKLALKACFHNIAKCLMRHDFEFVSPLA